VIFDMPWPNIEVSADNRHPVEILEEFLQNLIGQRVTEQTEHLIKTAEKNFLYAAKCTGMDYHEPHKFHQGVKLLNEINTLWYYNWMRIP